MRRMFWACVGLVAAVGAVTAGGRATAGSAAPAAPVTTSTVAGPIDPNATTTTVFGPAKGPLIVIPAGCTAPQPAFAVFTGTITALDDPEQPTTARFRIDRQLSGDLGPYLIAGETDVRYGTEARFLTIGQAYVVGVRADETTGRLVSTVREPAPLFGGDAVIGANDSDTPCPRVADSVRTLLPDGTSVDSGLLAPLRGHRQDLLWALMRPLLYALAVLVGLVLLKLAVFALGRALRDLSQPGDTPPPPPASPRHPSRPMPRQRSRRPVQPS